MNDDVVLGGKLFEKIVVVTTRVFHIVQVPIFVVLRPVDEVRGRELGASLLQTVLPVQQPDEQAGAAGSAAFEAWTVQQPKRARRPWADRGVERVKTSTGRFGPLAEEDVPEDEQRVSEETVVQAHRGTTQRPTKAAQKLPRRCGKASWTVGGSGTADTVQREATGSDSQSSVNSQVELLLAKRDETLDSTTKLADKAKVVEHAPVANQAEPTKAADQEVQKRMNEDLVDSSSQIAKTLLSKAKQLLAYYTVQGDTSCMMDMEELIGQLEQSAMEDSANGLEAFAKGTVHELVRVGDSHPECGARTAAKAPTATSPRSGTSPTSAWGKERDFEDSFLGDPDFAGP